MTDSGLVKGGGYGDVLLRPRLIPAGEVLDAVLALEGLIQPSL